MSEGLNFRKEAILPKRVEVVLDHERKVLMENNLPIPEEFPPLSPIGQGLF